MQLVIVSVFDAGTQTFARPFFVRAEGEARRSFQDEVNRVAADNPLHNHPGDFRLFKLGTFEDTTGLFVCARVPELLVDATACVVNGGV